ncbi:MAG: 16S rRNA pseudouridine516 synthase [Pseudoalteromonas rhizosphaerae]|jgi:16S rRNA pseudouridine516 synthase|uniref:Pseudouridine synthase n=1 Tax=Pseudoalteromonas neustonica TaxID=1840331 RepID=A0ABY3FGX5_9GAMM|nr:MULTISPECIES: 16S rRNA pseudouridine(516) synthase RsuA [Pseudoalteromonas]MBB1293822.1 16S rRNA pseudouridine(516) synthase RsuA [Pseudoalteromonas sp. SR41-4]MBB1408515.1 16S rRNA pseudouridine(516) synthase RsuA [Pseudoalteromonas sp. SG44-17]TVU84982.1 16S rRNA pseudouridine(516) synthase RsuA [Pseudoalteromonas neustonica]|tara:strand:+ start:15839 stop:16537 length:699 start_codon:yes stop_codon:yes gene_type:complete
MKFPCRLDKFISHLAETPRTKARAGIKRKDASVNGEVISAYDHPITATDNVLWQGKPLVFLGKRYYMLNKPVGYVCANSDELHPTVFDLLDEPNMSDFHVAGRLDLDTTGLVIITNDGDWSHKITSPKHNKFKTYLIETQEPLTDDALEKLRQGVQLHNEKELTRPAIAEQLATYRMRLSICEGKYHQVKRMLAAVGNKVVELHREKVANIELDEALASGEYRLLSAAEITL